MRYARFVDNVAVELLTLPEGFNIQQCFHPDIVYQFEAVSDDVTVGYEKPAIVHEEVIEEIIISEDPVVDETVTPSE